MMSLVANLTGSDARRLFQGLATYLVLVAALLAVHHGTAGSMWAIWAGSDTYAHAFLVPPISLWLVKFIN